MSRTKRRLKNSLAPIAGTMVRMVRHPGICLIARQAGLDFIMVDMEHGSTSIETFERMCAAGRPAGLDIFVRVPELSRAFVSRVLDAGATGVMSPMVETPEQARLLAGWSKYPPLGNRGYGTNSGHTGYTQPADAQSFMDSANRKNLTIAQVESVKGVAAADQIAQVDGIDALLIGPFDLSISLGCPGELTCEKENAAIEKVAAAAAQHGKMFGMHGSVELLTKWAGHGLNLIMSGIDTGMLGKAIQAINGELRTLIEAQQNH